MYSIACMWGSAQRGCTRTTPSGIETAGLLLLLVVVVVVVVVVGDRGMTRRFGLATWQVHRIFREAQEQLSRFDNPGLMGSIRSTPANQEGKNGTLTRQQVIKNHTKVRRCALPFPSALSW